MASNEASAWKRWLTKHYVDYLRAQRTAGGFLSDWKSRAWADAEKALRIPSWDKEHQEMFMRFCDSMWEEPPPPGQASFTVGGIEIQPYYTFCDPRVPGGFRRVAGDWATGRQAMEDATLASKKADELMLAASLKTVNAAKLTISMPSDPDAELWTHRSGPREQRHQPCDTEQHGAHSQRRPANSNEVL